ncbi:MAG: GspJ family type II secretion system protein [Tepidisphaeraceae bacterium]
MSFRRHRRSGFSLIELVLAMAMVSMLALTMYQAMRIAITARRSAYAAVDSIRAGVIAADLVRQDFESVPPPTGILAREFVGLHLPGSGGGDADGVEFSTIGRDVDNLDSPMSEGIRRVEFHLNSDHQPAALVRRVTRNLLATSEPQVEEEVLCRNVKSFSLRYFDGTSWQESWDSTTVGNNLPMAVAITLEIADPRAAQPDAPSRIITRLVPLACGKSLETLDTGGL